MRRRWGAGTRLPQQVGNTICGRVSKMRSVEESRGQLLSRLTVATPDTPARP